ncbi:hypothetical protein [Aliarcobacter butzleri]|uniref:hypothetical protein n=1 Tax=Aliarcobacter butzleri TaxID=28197 RepID=UPI002B24A6DF|nr:hypothetical protein [Aliarcobacter butzleri]
MDNPCLSRSLIADFTNKTCYKQTSTIVTNYAIWQWRAFSNSWANCGAEGVSYCPANSCDGFPQKNIGYTFSQNVDSWRCILSKTTYTCPTTYPIKLNNSTCEYREAF